jgi:hypothetical protein
MAATLLPDLIIKITAVDTTCPTLGKLTTKLETFWWWHFEIPADEANMTIAPAFLV